MDKSSPEHIAQVLKKVWKKIEKKQDEREEFSKISEDIKTVLGKKLSSGIKLSKINNK